MDKSIQVMLMYILTHVGLIFFVYPADIVCSMEIGHWLAVTVGFAIHIIFVIVYMKGLSYFNRQDLIDIYLTAGKAAAIALLTPVLFYLLAVNIITVRAYSEIVSLNFLSDTPLWVIMLLLVAVSTFMAVLGIESLFRTALLMAFLFLPLVAFVLLTVFQNADWHYLLPLADRKALSFSFVANRSFLQGLFAFAGGFLFLGFVTPYVKYRSRNIVWASLLLLPLFIISVYAPVLTFGQHTASLLQFPFITTIDTLHIDWLMFERVTMFFLLSMVTFVMLFMSLVLWKTKRILHRCIPSVKPIYITLALAIVIFVVCLQIPDWKLVEQLFWWNTILRLYVITVIPIMTLVLGIRHKRKDFNGHG
ncbi:GerAB/ArcD/ProY family transporter [Paenibacillus sp. NPDC056579]|uniref:GerAB/ArcD/ProY family transporter n=1 Tax=Paenibacillus sp. NPDC056579 TaxID=3345871 RepID=UPI0036BE9CA1